MSEKIKYGYGVTAETPTAEASAGAIPAGINEDVTFVSATFERLTDDETRPKLLMLNFEKNGAKLRDVTFELDIERMQENFDKYPPKPVGRAYEPLGLAKGDIPEVGQYIGIRFEWFNTRIKHILNCFLKDEDKAQTGDVNSYAEIVAVVLKKLKPFHGKTVRLKVTLNKDDYSELPNFPLFMEYEVETTQLKIGKRERIVPNTAGAAGAPASSGTAPPPPSAMSAPQAPPPPPPKA
jgi:hypothetical protein